MRMLPAVVLLLTFTPCGLAAQPADCPSTPSQGPMLPLALDLARRAGVPKGVTGQAYVAVPMGTPGIACQDVPAAPRDALRGKPGDVLGPPSRDLLRGPGAPRVQVETR